MNVSLLSTKLHVPRLRANAVSRPRLTERLLTCMQRPGNLILLSGPAGFGKTTLLSEFVHQLPHCVAWVSLDEADNDPIRFWTYVIAACQSVQPEIGESALALLQLPQPLPDETIPTLLINDIVRLQKDIVLVLDDYHAIQDSSIHTALSFLLDHLPDQFHLVVSTRVDPPWALARFRARDQLIEIRALDLRFTSEETAAFLNQVMDLNLSMEDVTALAARTEGWIASVQLAAISMRGRSDVTSFIKAFTGSHVYVAEYLMEEVLARQPEAVKTFLLQTSILERLNGSLCEAVNGRADSQAMLKDLYQANLFLLPLDEEGQWFRYHQLFADLLKARLQQTASANEITTLHQRAAAWYEQAGMTSEAIAQSLAAGDYSHAVQLVEKVALPTILKAYFKTVEEWVQAIPPEYLSKSPRVNMAFAWMHMMRRNFTEAAPHLERLQEIFAAEPEEKIESVLRGQWLALQSMLLNAQSRPLESRDLAEQALKILPENEAQVRSMTYMGLANAYEQLLDYESANRAAEAIIEHARAAGDLASEVFGSSFLGKLLVEQGSLHSAHAIATQALRRIEQTSSFSPFSATLYGELAQVHYHWHQLEEAREYFSRSVEWSLLGGFSDAKIYHSVFLSRLFQMEGDLQASIQEIEKALALVQTAWMAPALVMEEVVAQQVSIFLAVDRFSPVQGLLKRYGFSFHDGFSYPELAPGSTPQAAVSHAKGLLYNSALRTLLYAAGREDDRQALRQGIELANVVIEAALRSRQLPIALQALLLRAQLNNALGDHQAGLVDASQVLELAEPEGFISIFVEEGQPVAEILKNLLKRDLPETVPPNYVREILAAFPQAQYSKAMPGRQAIPGSFSEEEAEFLAPIESLTPRELEVLRLIAGGHSNQRIADKLVITLSAVKKHTGNIFRKLNVTSRTQAIARARQLGLLFSVE
jgi:LuxR family maltose regulon positive regulatory protein